MTGSIGRLFQSPLASTYAWSQIGNAFDTFLIKRLRESTKLTNDQRDAFDKTAKSIATSTQVYMRWGGAVAGASLKIAILTEELEKAAVKAAKFSGFGGMPGGRDAFEEAGKRKVQQYEMMMKYGEEFAQKFATTRDAMEKLLQRSGYGREAITQIIENQTALSQMTDVDVAGWAADVNSK